MTATAPDLVPLYGLTEDGLAFRAAIRQISAARVAARAAIYGETSEIRSVVIGRALRG